ncbi:major histocompatibility complex class I-related gene protein isoform X3 [Amia ocellicauda]|uniref:major histocompatibility complex class I-related gene protein isoform X3 n=1 Tax=Amia ocellicauda TaxID=2972642 RepID=UPI0034648B71
MKGLAAVLVTLCLFDAMSVSSHSLWYFLTLTTGQTDFPELVIVGMVDDVQMEYYDSTVKKVLSRRHWAPNPDIVEFAEIKLDRCMGTYYSMKDKLQRLTVCFNHSEGLHTYQRIAGCELDDDGTVRFKAVDAYDGQEVLSYNPQAYSWNALLPDRLIDPLMLKVNRVIDQNVYQPMCVRILKSHLQQDTHIVNRKEKPRVRVFSRGAEVVCLATGFYPRAVEVTLLRDGQPVPEQQLSGGEVLPNGDGTYQLRRSLTVSKQEQREHQYSCTVTHSSMDNKLHMDWELQPEPDAGLLAGAVIGALLALLIIIIIIIGIFIWRRKRKPAGAGLDCRTGAAVKYSAAHRSDGKSSRSSISSVSESTTSH